ncbi:lipid A biosynthesis acyltransferase [Candidatus Pelagibacter sp.]|nr:lipid A biosynthesis acyltransferase [Candidatus Pelagibacter sp.]
MKHLKYFLEFLIISILFLIFRIVGYRFASNFGNLIGKLLGPIFRSKKIIKKNIKIFSPTIKENEIEKIIKKMWGNYGRILAEYPYIPSFRKKKLDNYLMIDGLENLEKIKKNKKPALFISGHFNNFELMAMTIEREGVDLFAIYRPLNNKFLNLIMEYLRKKYICKNQIEKGLKGLRKALALFKKGKSLAIMIDQRVSEGMDIELFGKNAFTTTIPAQFVKKFGCIIQPVYIQRIDSVHFKVVFDEHITFEKNQSIEKITKYLNKWLEKKITKNPDQWIWTHNRWKH